jgi:hypothetical protein
MRLNPSALSRLSLIGALVGALAQPASAGEKFALRAPPPRYQQECSGCHLAYPPGMLPADSWRRLLSNLSRHFGTDASLAPDATAELSGWLAATASTGRGVRDAPPEDRITRSRWFTREHDDVPAAAWRSTAVRSAGNCTACHVNADKGDFDERQIRIPR